MWWAPDNMVSKRRMPVPKGTGILSNGVSLETIPIQYRTRLCGR
jgi:hypothetical protein